AELSARHQQLTAEAVRSLVNDANLPRLRRLDLGKSLAGDGAAEALAESARLEDLRELKLASCGLTAAGAAALAAGPWRHLRTLWLADNPVGAAGAAALARSEALSGLVRLDLSRCLLTDDGVKALAASPRTDDLVELALSDNGLTDEAAKA